MVKVKCLTFGLRKKANKKDVMIQQKKIVLFILIFSWFTGMIFCQNYSPLRLITNINDYQVHERAMLILNQDLYLVGEPINFYALTYDVTFGIPIEFSSILYIELYDQDNQVLNQKKILLDKGEAINDILIPRNLKTGYYYLRAYTNYMKNFGVNTFFTQRMKVVNPFMCSRFEVDDAEEKIPFRLKIAAEGGKIIYNVKSKIALFNSESDESFCATLLENDSVITRVDCKNGFGVFNFIPFADKVYRIEALSKSKQKVCVKLDQIEHSGIVFKLDSVLHTNAYGSLLKHDFNKYPVAVEVYNGGVGYKYESIINTIDSALCLNLPLGVNYIVLRDNEMNEISRRPVYIKPKNKLELSASLKINNTSDSISLDINTDINDSITYLVSLSLNDSVANKAPMLDAISLAPAFDQLSINELNYACNRDENANDYILKYLDNKDLNKNKVKINYLPEISRDIVSGRISQIGDIKEEGSLEHRELYLSFIDTLCWVSRCESDSVGKFMCHLPLKYQGESLIISVNDTTNNYTIAFDDEFFPDFVKIQKQEYYPNVNQRELLEQRMINLQINDAYSKQCSRKNFEKRPDLRFYGSYDSEYIFAKYRDLPYLEEFIFEIVDEAIPVKHEGSIHIKVLTEQNRKEGYPLVIFDGIPLIKASQLAYIPCNELESIRIVSDIFYWENKKYEGIIDVSSKSGTHDLVETYDNSLCVDFCPVKTGLDNYKAFNRHIPYYTSSLYFNILKCSNSHLNIKVRKPDNKGNYFLNIFALNKKGEWVTYKKSKAIIMK